MSSQLNYKLDDTGMDPLHDYVQHWFEHTALRIGPPGWLDLNARRIADVASARPGFTSVLRAIALDRLGTSDRELSHRALAALAVVGTRSDLARIESLSTSPDTWIAGAAKTAAFEIAHRVV